MTTRFLILLFILAELFSYAGYFFPWINTIGFFVIIVAALVLSMKRLEYGLYFILADLILGGKSGALFSFEYGGFFVSLRMALFIVVMSVWLSKLKIKDLRFRISDLGILRWWGVFGIAVLWGIVVGFLRRNNFGDLFLDVNGYFYAALILPFWWSITRKEVDTREKTRILKNLGIVFLSATTWVAFETLFLVYFWTHGLNNYIAANLRPVYEWLRDTGVGEITLLDGNFARVFLQSQIFSIVAFLVLLVYLVRKRSTEFCALLSGAQGAALLVLNITAIIVSFSRSFWIGTLAGLAILVALIGQARQIWRIGLIVASAIVLALGVIFAISFFPLPRPSPMDLSLAAQSRLQSEEAVASRWNLLPPLWSAIKKHALIGKGFGADVTYISNDPRIRETSIFGKYTTYAFEWGWMDVWLKMGAVGLISLIGLISYIGFRLYKLAKSEPLYLVGLAGLVSLATIHFFTPYLNHPLGLGILILISILLV